MNKTKKNIDILRDQYLNKSTAFTQKERTDLKLIGLIPDKIETLDLQLQRVLMQLSHKHTDIDQYIYLMNLLDHNETLFYKTVRSNPTRFLPIIYDPVIGEACLKFGHIYRNQNGMYLSMTHKGKVKEILQNWPEKDIRFICVTNGGRILGLGDLGANGMGIPIGKLQLYTATAGVPTQHLLPIFLDSGTNNRALLNDPLYLGLKQTRPETKKLVEFVDEFVEAVQEVFPNCCIHFEDWTGTDAVHLLERYKDKVCCYNDDIQGTAAITLAGMLNAVKLKKSKIEDESFLFLGAGSAGIGLSNLLCAHLVKKGLSLEKARSKIHMFDIKGLIESSRTDLSDFQMPYAHKHTPMGPGQFVDAIKEFKPTTIIGVSTMGGTFTKEVIEAMRSINKRPIILALSNPTQHAECTPVEAYKWSNGTAIYAAGVQFPPVTFKDTTFTPGQANNFFIFPAVGMAIYATNASRVTDDMFIEAAYAVASEVSDAQLQQGLIYPMQDNILETEIKTAARVAKLIFDLKLARVDKPQSSYEEFIRQHVYYPSYDN